MGKAHPNAYGECTKSKKSGSPGNGIGVKTDHHG